MFKFLRLICLCAPRILYDYFAWMLRYSIHPERYTFEVRYAAARKLIIKTIKNFRLNLQVDELEILNNEKRAFVLVSNHLSMMDALVLVAISERPITFITKKEVKKSPFAGRVLRSVEGSLLDRKDLRQNVAVMEEAERRLNAGYCSYVVYPEGHRNPDPFGPMLPFHPGSFKLAYRTGVPVIAMAEFGNFRPFKRQLNYKSYLIQVRFFRPHEKEEYLAMTTTEFAPLVEKQVSDEVEAMKIKDKAYMDSKAYKQYPPDPQWYEVYVNGKF
jgi:1-acyl-sn-glycerol-3-phosphate acyltransferase